MAELDTASPDLSSASPQVPDTLPIGGAQNQPLPTEHVDPLSPEAYQRVVSGETVLYKNQAAERERLERGESAAFQQYQAQLQDMLHAEGATFNDTKPWNPQTMAPPPTNLWEKFGSPGFIIGMLASSFTAMPMVSALNAGAAAMNAINEGDNESYHKAFDTWKVNSELAIKRFNMEKEAFDQIEHLQKNSMDEWHAKATALAARFNDERMQVLLQNGMYPDAIKNQEALAQLIPQTLKAQRALDDNNTRLSIIHAITQDENGKLKPEYAKDPKKWAEAARTADAALKDETTAIGVGLQELRLSPEWEQAGSKEREEMLAKVMRDLSPYTYGRGAGSAATQQKLKSDDAMRADIKAKHKDWTDGQVERELAREKAKDKTTVTANKLLDIKSHIRQYDEALDNNIEPALDVLNKYAFSAGIGGGALRWSERISNIFGGNETDRVEMERKLDELKTRIPRLLLDLKAAGRLSAGDADRVNHIVAGLSMGDTVANTVRGLNDLADELRDIQAGNIKDLEEAEPADETVEPTAKPAKTKKPDDEPWKNDPVAH